MMVFGAARAGLRFFALTLGGALLLAGCETVGPTGSAEAPEAAVRSTSTAPKPVLVGFVAAPGAEEVALIESYGGTVTHRYKYIPVFAATIPADVEAALAEEPSVAYVEEDYEVIAWERPATAAAETGVRGKQVVDWGVRKIEAPAAWELGYTGSGVKVGIFDTGIDLDHPDLEVHGGVDLLGDGFGIDDCNGHGTHVGGTVAAKNNGNHTVGVAPGAQLYAMRLLDCAGSGSFSNMIVGLEWAIDNGMDVVNMSFGTVLPTILSEAADAALQAAVDAGVVLVAASGNSSVPYVGYPASHPAVIATGATNDADMLSDFSQYGTEQDLTAPGVNILASYLVGQGQETSLTVDSDNGRELGAIALVYAGKTRKQGITAENVYAGFGTAPDYAALDCSGKTAVVSRGGGTFAEKAVAAMDAGCAALVIHNNLPGNFNGTLGTETAPDGRAWIPVVSISLEEGLYLKDQIETRQTITTLINAAGNLAILSGTSMASPHAAGVAALILSKNPSLTPSEVRAILRASADDLGVPGWDPQYGYGRVNARKAVQ